MEIVAVFYACGHYHHVFFAVQGIVRRHCDAEHALVDGKRGVHGAVTALGEHAERHAVGEHVHHLFYGFVVAEHLAYAVALANHVKDTEEAEYARDRLIVENIRPGAKNAGAPVCTQHHQGVHQTVAMIGGDDNRLVPWDILLSFHPDMPVAETGACVHIWT